MIDVLGTFTCKCCTSGGGTNDETTGQLVGCSPEMSRSALETEHRVKDVDRNDDLRRESNTMYPAAVSAEVAPASLIPTCQSWPCDDSL